MKRGDGPKDDDGVFGRLGRPKDPGTRFVGADEDPLEIGDHDDDPNKLGVFGYVKLETEYVDVVDAVMGWPLAELNGVINEGEIVGAADGITGELSVEAGAFADKLPTLKRKTRIVMTIELGVKSLEPT